MKIQYILILFMLISCSQNTKEKKKNIVKSKDTVDFVIDSPKKVDDVSFNKIISEIKTKTTPLTDSTNFDNFKGENFFNKQEVEALKLEKMYPSFYKKTHNYKATASYKIEFSKDFHSIVLTILKGDHEMESVLINYDLNGGIIDSKVISYDEIAEGWSRIESKIEKNKLTVSKITWFDERVEEKEHYLIKPNGKIKRLPLTSSNSFSQDSMFLLTNVIDQLNLNKSKIKTDLITSKVRPNNMNETIVIIPEIVDEDDHFFELNSHILIVDNTTGKIINKYFETSKTNNWTSDAIVLAHIKIDTAPYKVAGNNEAFGIRVYYRGLSKANPYRNETISLFIKSDNSLKRILKNYDVDSEVGQWDTKCAGEYLKHKMTLIITANKTNNYYDILVKNKITKTTVYEDENGDCDDKEKVTTEETLLKFNGEEYKG